MRLASHPLRYALLLAPLAATAPACSPPPCDPSPDANAPRTLEFVVSSFAIEDLDSPDVPHTGFNLDGRVSGPTDRGGCSHQDFFSTLDSDQNAPGDACTAQRTIAGEFCGGVDNQLPTYVGTIRYGTPTYDPEAILDDDIRRGARLLVLRVADVNCLTDDPHVELTLVAAFDADASCEDNLTGAGRFVADARSFEGGDPTRPLWHATGAIVRGRLRTTAPFVAPFPVPFMNTIRDYPGNATQIRFDISSDGARATRGNWGAWVDPRPVMEDWIAADPAFEALGQYAASLVDIRVTFMSEEICVAGTGATARYGGISGGIGFEAVSAVVTGVATSPPAGACGATAHGDAGADGGG